MFLKSIYNKRISARVLVRSRATASLLNNLARVYRNVCRSNGCPLRYLSETLANAWVPGLFQIYCWNVHFNNRYIIYIYCRYIIDMYIYNIHIYMIYMSTYIAIYYIPRPSNGVKFEPPGLFLVVKGLEFRTLGGFWYISFPNYESWQPVEKGSFSFGCHGAIVVEPSKKCTGWDIYNSKERPWW